jgi:D-amino-acid dehydrogenase
VREHDALAPAGGRTGFIRRNGWLKVFRTERERDKRFAGGERWRAEFGVHSRLLDAAGLQEIEPHVAPVLVGAIHWTDPTSGRRSARPRLAYLRAFETLGGRFVQGKRRRACGRRVRLGDADSARTARASAAVIALGPWADVATRALGYDLPLAVKRGYHMHYRAAGEAKLNHPILDTERGYLIAPMRRGIRLTTGAEFACAMRSARRCSSVAPSRSRATSFRSPSGWTPKPGWARARARPTCCR